MPGKHLILLSAATLLMGASLAGAAESGDPHVAVAERYVRGLYGCQPEVVRELGAADITVSYPIFQKLFGKPALAGQEAVTAFAEHFCHKWAEPEFVVHESIADGDKVVLVWSFSARDTETQGAPRSFWGGMSLIRFDGDGRISEEVGEESEPGPMERLAAGRRAVDGAAQPVATAKEPSRTTDSGLWPVYEHSLRNAKYIDLTHTLTPAIPVWRGFGPATFAPALNPETGQPYRYAQDGFEATHYDLSTDQFGTQLDPPAHWAPEYPAIDELPPTYAVRPLVVISIVDKVANDPGYSLQVADIRDWEKRHGSIPAGSVVMVRSDWSKDWPDPQLASRTVFPGVSLAALKFLHEQRHILFHGHEPLDTDATPTLEGEHWLMHHGYTQAEGVAHLDQVPETGCLVTIGYPKFKGGLGGYARYVAICPADWHFGIAVGEVPEAPLPRHDKLLEWDSAQGVRVRK